MYIRAIIPLLLTASLYAAPAGLVERSPFLPPGFNDREPEPEPVVQAPPPAPSTLEYTGFVKTYGQYQFAVTDKSTGKHYLVRMNEDRPDVPFKVTNFDERTDSIHINNAGRAQMISRRAPSARPSIPNLTPSVPRPGTPRVATPNNNTVVNVGRPDRNNPEQPRRIIRRRVITPTE